MILTNWRTVHEMRNAIQHTVILTIMLVVHVGQTAILIRLMTGREIVNVL